MGDSEEDKTKFMMRAVGRFVETLNDRFFTCTDLGTYGEDFVYSAKEAFGDDSLEGLKIAVQGLGKVGYRLLEYLHEEGAELIGTVINDETIPQLKCKAIVGSANNQLESSKHGDILYEEGIVYAPDYVANAGGLMQVADEVIGYNEDRVMAQAKGIYDMLEKIFAISNEKDIPTHKAANHIVEERIEKVKKMQSNYVNK